MQTPPNGPTAQSAEGEARPASSGPKLVVQQSTREPTLTSVPDSPALAVASTYEERVAARIAERTAERAAERLAARNAEQEAARLAQPVTIAPPETPATGDPGNSGPAVPPVVAEPKAPATKTPAPEAPAPAVAPPVRAGHLKRRHFAVMFSFLLCVVGPMAVSGWYLWARAADQYASTVAFSVRSEVMNTPFEMFGGLTALSGSSSSDTDILYEFIQSQKMVEEIDAEIDLRAIWSRPQNDPVFTYVAPGTIEDLTRHWGRMVKIYYDSSTSLIEVRALAFTSDDATRIATAIQARSSAMINSLTTIAREDSMRYARDELDRAVERLKLARTAVTDYRNRNQIIDPSIDIQSQAGLLGSLEAQLAAAIIEVDMMTETIRQGDPRLEQANRRVEVIKERIASERQKMGMGDGTTDGAVFADLVGEYERLAVDRQFAETTYTVALAAFDGAVAQAQRQNRYLAAHVLPTTAEKAEYPQRLTLVGLVTLFAFLAWSIGVLIVYSIKDRR